jgi:hypothetical protein
MSGNVGIGTTTPKGSLDVLAATSGANYVYFFNNVGSTNPTSTAGMFLGWNKSSGSGESILGYSTQTGSDPRLDFASWNGTTYSTGMTLKSGNVGIGTTSPGARLDVSGGATQTSGDLVVDTTGTGTVTLGRLDSTSGNNTTFKFRDRLGSVKSRWNNASSGSIYFGNFQASNYGVSLFTGNVDINAATNGLLDVNAINRADGIAATFSNGNVGIGTISPGSRLDVVSTLVAASGTDYGMKVLPTYNQTSTAGGTDLLINRTQTVIGSGLQKLIDAQVGGTSKFIVDNAGTVTLADAANIAVGTTTGTKIGTATNQKLGFFNATPVVQPSAYTATNATTDRAFDASSTTLDEVADVLGTLISDLKTLGLIG